MSPLRFSPICRLLACLALGAMLCWSAGCGGGPSLTPVSGKVTMKGGKPLTSGTVIFKPDKTKGNTFGGEPIGEINSNGEYTLQTKGKPGAPLGAYKVVISVTAATTEDNTKVSTKQLINTTYTNPDTTPLEKTVVDKASPGAYDLEVGP